MAALTETWVHKRLLFVALSSGVLVFSSAAAFASRSPRQQTALFGAGPETFLLHDPSGQVPSFRILSDSTAKQALALAIEATLNSQETVEPKLPVDGHIDLRFESLTLLPAKGDRLKLRARVSGHELDIDKDLSQADLLAGKTIDLAFAPAEKSISLFQVRFTGGHFRFRLDRAAKRLVIEDANARALFSAPFGGEGEEAIRFHGRGDRVPPTQQEKRL